jgi:hypothetical protein
MFTVVKCRECGTKYDMGDPVQAEEWNYGHDCPGETATHVEREEDQTRAIPRPDYPAVPYVLIIGEHFDGVHGNSYFGGRIIATATGEIAPIRYQYGRGELAYLHAASVTLGQDIYDRERGVWWPSVVIVRVPCRSRKAVERLAAGQ